MVRADYDRGARLLAVDLAPAHSGDVVAEVRVAPRATVLVDQTGVPVTVEITSVELGVHEPLTAVLDRWPKLPRRAVHDAASVALADPQDAR